jgi:FecR-like protein
MIKVARVTGEVFALDQASGLKSRLATSSLVTQGQSVLTSANSSAVLVFSNGAVVNVKADSVLEVDQFLQNPFGETFRIREALHEPSVSTTHLSLRKGEMVSQVKKLNRDAGSSFTVETPVGAAGIRGTAFRLAYRSQGNLARFVLSMAEGLIQFVPITGHSVDVAAGKELGISAEINSSTGAVTSLGEVSTPTDVSAPGLADLQQDITDSLGAALNIDFSPATSTNGQTTSQSNSGTPTDPAAETASPSNGPTGQDSNPLGSPPAVPAAQRTTPGDGL